jgi:hypothetical protein
VDCVSAHSTGYRVNEGIAVEVRRAEIMEIACFALRVFHQHLTRGRVSRPAIFLGFAVTALPGALDAPLWDHRLTIDSEDLLFRSIVRHIRWELLIAEALAAAERRWEGAPVESVERRFAPRLMNLLGWFSRRINTL